MHKCPRLHIIFEVGQPERVTSHMRFEQPRGSAANCDSLAGSDLCADQIGTCLKNVQFVDWDAHGRVDVKVCTDWLRRRISALDLPGGHTEVSVYHLTGSRAGAGATVRNHRRSAPAAPARSEATDRGSATGGVCEAGHGQPGAAECGGQCAGVVSDGGVLVR